MGTEGVIASPTTPMVGCRPSCPVTIHAKPRSPWRGVSRRFVMHRVVKVTAGLALILLLPSVVSAQATIAGVVRDPSAAVLPGVSVEAASPVLIEKTRTVV